MDVRHEIRLTLLALAILVGMAVQEMDRSEVAACDNCAEPVSAVESS